MTKTLTELLHTACSPANLDVFLNKTLQILGGADVFGPKAGLALIPGSGFRQAAIFKNFSKAEQALLLAGRKPAGGLFLKVPLWSSGKDRGLLAVRLSVPVDGAAQLLKITAEMAGARLSQEKRDNSLNRERDMAAAVGHIEELFLACPGISLKEISRAVLDEGRRLTGSAFGFAGYIDPASGSLVAITLTDNLWKTSRRVKDRPYIFREFKGLWGWVLKKKKPLLTNDAAADPKAAGLPPGHIKIDRFLGVPALYDGKLLGILALANPAGPYVAQDLETAARLAQTYAVMLNRVLQEMRLAEERDSRQKLISSSRDIIYSVGMDGRIRSMSPRVKDYGYTPEEMLGRSVFEFAHPDDVGILKAALNNARRTGKALPALCYRILRKDGSFFYAEQKSGILKRGGVPVLISGVIRDVDEKHSAEACLKESEARYKALFESANQAILTADAATGAILDANRQAEILFGRTRAELVGMDRLLLHPASRKEEYIRQFRDHARRRSAKDENSVIVKKDGTLVPVSIKASLLEFNGRKVLQGIFEDISGQKRMFEAVKRREARYRDLVEDLNDAIFQIDTKGVITYISPRIFQLSGFRPEDIIGRPFADFIYPDDLAGLRRSFQDHLKGRDAPAEFRWFTKDGELRWARSSSKPAIENGITVGIRGILSEITEQKRLADTLAGNEAKYRTLFETSRDALMIVDTATWKFTQANDEALRVFGVRDMAAFLKLAPWTISPKYQPDGRLSSEKARELMQLAVSSGSNSFEWMHKRSDGALFTSEVLLTRVEMGGKRFILASVRDISARKRTEELLRQNEARMRMILAQLNGVLWVMDKDLRFTLSRGKGLSTLGLRPDQVVGMSLEEFIRPAGPGNASLPAHRRALQGENVVYEETFGQATFNVVLSPLKDADGKINGVIGVGMDVTEKMAMERKLRENERFLDSVVDNIPNMVFVKDAKDLRFVRLNKAAEELLGVKAKDLLGRNDHDNFPQKEADFFTRMDRKVLSEKKLMDIQAEQVHTQHGDRLLHTKKIPILDNSGKPLYLLGISEDITERRRMEKLLTENEATLRQIVDTATDAIFLKGVDGRYIKANKACSRLLLVDHTAMPGKTAEELFSPEMAASIAKEDQEVLRQGKTVTTTRERVTPSGKIYLSAVRTPLRGPDGKIIGVLGVVRDITNLKKMETELAVARATEALSKMARPMAHDFNNALTAIVGYASLIDDELAADSPIKQEISQIVKAVKRAEALTTKFQDFARNPKLPADDKTGPGGQRQG